MPHDARPTPGASPEDDRRDRRERERDSVDHLGRVHGTLELQAAVLALLSAPGDGERAARAWEATTGTLPHADKLLAHVNHLSGPARLPWFETLVSRMRGQPPAARRALLEATRRVMNAHTVARPIDRLLWLEMRRRLGAASSTGVRAPAATELSRLPQREVSAIASVSAFLSRMVPIDAADDTAALLAPGVAWYDDAMAPWRAHAVIAPCRAPDGDGLAHALQTLQALTWMQRPLLVRGWVDAALRHSRHSRLVDGAADALRLSCSLLDCPLPPELARHYGADPPNAP